MRDSRTLFLEEDLDAQLRGRQDSVGSTVDAIPKDQFLVSSDDELVEHISAKLSVEPLILHEESMVMNQSETQVDVSGDRNRIFHSGRSGPFFIPGTRVDIDVPFTGEEWIFQFRTNPWSTSLPRGLVERGNLRLTITQPHDADPSRFKSFFEQNILMIRECVERSRKQVETYNSSLPRLVEHAVSERRKRLQRHENLAAILDIPLATRPGTPSITPVKIEVRNVPKLRAPPKTGLRPEPGIADATFENILRFIRHQGRTFERTPSTFAVHGEEDLRNIIMAQLNGHFEGLAVGEAFRASGKTDICIEQEDRAAFVGECKIWSGPSGLLEAINQLLSYLTWRDSKAALIMFNTKNKDFSKLLDTMPETLRRHELFLHDLAPAEAGEWRVQMRSKEDAGRRVILHTFAFDLYHTGIKDAGT